MREMAHQNICDKGYHVVLGSISRDGMPLKVNTSDDQKLGTHIITRGLFIQVVFFGVFIIVSAIFHYGITRTPTINSPRSEPPWPRYMIVLLVATCLIIVRFIFRVTEYVQGHDGALLKTEGRGYIFDAMSMFLIWHYSLPI